MTAQLHAELLKLRTTRTTAALLLAGVAMTLLGVAVELFGPQAAELATEDAQRGIFTSATGAVFFATFAGLLAVTSEFRYGTIRPTLVIQPHRPVVLAAKLVAAVLAGLLFAALAVPVALGAGVAGLAARDIDVVLSGADVLAIGLGTCGTAVLSAVLGAAVGALIRNQVGAIVAVAAYAFTVDAVLFAAVPDAGRYLPGKAGDALAGLPEADLLAPGTGGLVMLAWTVAFVVAALVRTQRTDI